MSASARYRHSRLNFRFDRYTGELRKKSLSQVRDEFVANGVRRITVVEDVGA